MHIYLKKSALYVSVFVAALFFTSCLSNTESEYPSQLQIGFGLDYIDSTYTQSNDSIVVDRVRVIHGQSYFETSEQDSLYLSSNVQMVELNPESPQFSNPLLIGRGNFPTGSYQAFTFVSPRAPEGNSQIDDIFTDGGQYSMIIQGTYNDESFTYKSSRVFEQRFPLNINVPESNASFTFVIQSDTRTWFVQAGGEGLLDPSVSANAEAINNNIQQSIQIEQLEP